MIMHKDILSKCFSQFSSDIVVFLMIIMSLTKTLHASAFALDPLSNFILDRAETHLEANTLTKFNRSLHVS